MITAGGDLAASIASSVPLVGGRQHETTVRSESLMSSAKAA